MYKIDEIKMLRLGQRDENLAREIPMDASEWLELYPGASIQILFRRPGESTITPMVSTLVDGVLTWLIHDYEVGKTGVGNAEIRAVDVAGLRRKSRIIPCSIEETLLGDDETVLYTQDQVDVTLANIGQAAESALAAKASEEAAALSAENASGSADAAQAAQDAAESARDAAQAAQTAAEEAEAGAETAQSGAIASEQAAENARIAAQTARASAQGSASQAAADKAAAQTAQQEAETAQHAAETAAGNAQASAGAASGSASAAAQSASDAAASAASIGEAEQHAAASAQAAAQSATQAAGSATSASGSASAASGSASQAAGSATQAAGSAASASQSATAAQAVLDSIPEDYTALSEDVSDLKSALTTPFVWKNGYYSIAAGVFAPQSGTVTYHSTEKYSGNEIPNIYNWDLVQSGDSFFMVWNNGAYAGYLMDGVWKKNTTVLDEPPVFSEWAITLHNVPNYQDVRFIPFLTDAFGKIAVMIPRYSDSRKIAITDTEIIFPAYTKIVYDNGYYARSSTITVARSAPSGGTVSDEVVVFDVASKTIKTYPTTSFSIASTERILFTLGIGDKSCSLAGSMYTYNGKPPFMPYDTAENTTITNLNDVSALTEKIIETKYCGNNSKTGLSLIHFSDIHGSVTNIQRIIDLADYYSAYVDDIIHTGDSVATYYANNNPFATVGGNRVLNAIGNHECWIEGDTWPHPYNATAAQTYDKFFSPYISSWGVASAGTNLCYYYKDYASYNIRLIVLDALHYDSAQETWLTSVLAEAKTNGYSVIIAEHYPPQTGITPFDCTFTSYGISVDPVADPEEGAQIERLPESAYTAVDTFITGGGKFICWLAGHTHYDFVGKVTGHLNQIVVLINCGVVDARYGTDKRINGTKTQDCLNVVGFDTTNHIIKLCRVGISIDWFGRAKNYLSIDYDNKQIIANT